MSKEIIDGNDEKDFHDGSPKSYAPTTNYNKDKDLAEIFETGLDESFFSKCATLTKVYVKTRYPDFFDESPSHSFTKELASEHITFAEEILAWVEKRISKN